MLKCCPINKGLKLIKPFAMLFMHSIFAYSYPIYIPSLLDVFQLMPYSTLLMLCIALNLVDLIYSIDCFENSSGFSKQIPKLALGASYSCYGPWYNCLFPSALVEVLSFASTAL